MMSTSVITSGLSVRHKGRYILQNVTLDFPGRGISIIAGRSGSGKTTFLRSLNRLNEELGLRTEGEVKLNFGAGPEPVYGPSAHKVSEIRRRAGMVFQTPNVLPASIWKNMALPLSLLASVPKTEMDGRIEKSLAMVGLWAEVKDRLKAEAASLSGGQQQRLCLARALSLEPDLLLLDEPTASMDVYSVRQIEESLKGLSENYPLIIVSHSLSQAWRLADHLHFFHNGHYERMIRKDEIGTEEELTIYLESLS